MAEELQIRIHGVASLPTLIYLPGLHGDWTLVGGFRRQLAGQVRFIEFTYPRTLTWTLDDYAAAVETTLAQNGITRGWLLGESYGSQIVWALIARKKFSAKGIILAGGFVRHPSHRGMRIMQPVFNLIPGRLLLGFLSVYAKLLRFRYRRAPETLAGIDEFIMRRTKLDYESARHRLKQIAGFDPRETVRAMQLPVFYLSGGLDPIVPWPLVRRWLRKNCPSLRDTNIIFSADHNILGTAPEAAAKQVLHWITEFVVDDGCKNTRVIRQS